MCISTISTDLKHAILSCDHSIDKVQPVLLEGQEIGQGNQAPKLFCGVRVHYPDTVHSTWPLHSSKSIKPTDLLMRNYNILYELRNKEWQDSQVCLLYCTERPSGKAKEAFGNPMSLSIIKATQTKVTEKTLTLFRFFLSTGNWDLESHQSPFDSLKNDVRSPRSWSSASQLWGKARQATESC